MGNTVWIDVQGRPGTETHRDMSVLHRLCTQLDEMAGKLGVMKVTAFYDYSELLKENGEIDDLPEPIWFDVSEGLITFTVLRQAVEGDWGAVGWNPDGTQQYWPETLLSDLQYCESVLQQAAIGKSAFRLLVVA